MGGTGGSADLSKREAVAVVGVKLCGVVLRCNLGVRCGEELVMRSVFRRANGGTGGRGLEGLTAGMSRDARSLGGASSLRFIRPKNRRLLFVGVFSPTPIPFGSSAGLDLSWSRREPAWRAVPCGESLTGSPDFLGAVAGALGLSLALGRCSTSLSDNSVESPDSWPGFLGIPRTGVRSAGMLDAGRGSSSSESAKRLWKVGTSSSSSLESSKRLLGLVLGGAALPLGLPKLEKPDTGWGPLPPLLRRVGTDVSIEARPAGLIPFRVKDAGGDRDLRLNLPDLLTGGEEPLFVAIALLGLLTSVEAALKPGGPSRMLRLIAYLPSVAFDALDVRLCLLKLLSEADESFDRLRLSADLARIFGVRTGAGGEVFDDGMGRLLVDKGRELC